MNIAFMAEKSHTPGQVWNTKRRTVADAELIKEGARFVQDEGSNKNRLQLTDEQVKKAKVELGQAQLASKDSDKELVNEKRVLSDAELIGSWNDDAHYVQDEGAREPRLNLTEQQVEYKRKEGLSYEERVKEAKEEARELSIEELKRFLGRIRKPARDEDMNSLIYVENNFSKFTNEAIKKHGITQADLGMTDEERERLGKYTKFNF